MKGPVVSGPDHAAGGLGHRLPSPRREPGAGCHPPTAPGPDPRSGSSGGGAGRVPLPEEMEEEAIADAPGNETEDVDFLPGLELVDLLDPQQPDWPLEPGLSSPWGGG